MEIVTFIIAIIGCVLSVGNWAYTLLNQRKNLTISVVSTRITTHSLTLLMQFENRSRLPIAITRLRAEFGETLVDCAAIPTVVLEKNRSHGSDTYERKIFYSEQLPISLSPLGAKSGFVLFEKLQEGFRPLAKQLTLSVATNRGNEFQMTLSLPENREILL